MAQAPGQHGLGPNGLGPLPTLYLSFTDMTPNPNFEQRYSRDGTWLPPRPYRSNIPNSTPVWYRYQTGATTPVHTPDTRLLQHYQTYSFYASATAAATRLFIYPQDALRHKVGDGTGNRRLSHSPIVGNANIGHDSSDESDAEQREPRRDIDDWRELAFTWYQRDNAFISHAEFRGHHGTRLRVRWPDQGQIRELLPSRYHADGTTTVPQGYGGMTGEMAILIALVIYSLPPDRLNAALTGCLGANYRPHGLPHGYGWINMRGLVVSVWYERERTQALGSRNAATAVTAAQKIRLFETGLYFGYGKFVI